MWRLAATPRSPYVGYGVLDAAADEDSTPAGYSQPLHRRAAGVHAAVRRHVRRGGVSSDGIGMTCDQIGWAGYIFGADVGVLLRGCMTASSGRMA